MASLVKSPFDAVGDEEVLFRATRPSHIQIRDGRIVISSQAWSDATQEISVDRADLQSNDPQPTLQRLDTSGGVVSITAKQVRDVAPLTHQFKDEKGRPILTEGGAVRTATNGVDVFPDPFPPQAPDNQAHALVKGVVV